MKTLWNKEPVMVSQVAAVIVALGAVFGFQLTQEQGLALATVISLVAGLVARSQVSPTT